MNKSIVALLASTAVSACTAAGAGAYGPTPTPSPPPSSGTTPVLASATRGPAGGSITTHVGQTRVTVGVPPGALGAPVQLTLVALEHVKRAAKLGRVVAGIGVRASTLEGTPVAGRVSRRPMTVTLTNPRFASNDRVVVWNPANAAFVPVRPRLVTRARGTLTIRFNRTAEFAVVAPR
jgi:hypothetical protein